jgi:NADH:ubiquinone oxidoreductase subunit F (NADH-binding)
MTMMRTDAHTLLAGCKAAGAAVLAVVANTYIQSS